MAKTKGGRSMNPTDAFRKEERRKQVNRNKLERKFQREAHRKLNNASSLKAELNSIIAEEESGQLNKTLRLKKKVLKGAYDQALRKQRETEMGSSAPVEEEMPEIQLEEAAEPSPLQNVFPVPAPPPLPPGEPPKQLGSMMTHCLPPHSGPLPGYGPLPPPPGPPPGLYPMPVHVPMYSLQQVPQSASFHAHKGCIEGAVAGMAVARPMSRPPSIQRSTADVVKDHKPTITAAPTVVKKPLAQNDKALTSMIPASVKIKREANKQRGSSVRKPNLTPGVTATPKNEIQDNSQTSMEQKMSAFLSEVEELGAFDT